MPDRDERKSPVDGNNLKCSFCGNAQLQVEMLIAVPGVAICIECIDLCNEIIADARAEGSIPPRSPWPPVGSRSWVIRPPANPKIGELLGARQRPAERLAEPGCRAGGQPVGWRVTV